MTRPVRSHSGCWIVDGWSAWLRLPGTELLGSWREALAVSPNFHRLVSHVGWDEALVQSHPWGIADRYAWGEETMQPAAWFDEVAARLTARRTPLDLPSQLVHGDLINNVLFAPGLPPGVIDITPHWRPARYADAIIAIEAMSGAPTPTKANQWGSPRKCAPVSSLAYSRGTLQRSIVG